MLVRRAVLALGQRRALAWLPLASCRPAACDAAVEGACVDLLLDEFDRGRDAFVDCPGNLRLRRDRKVAANVLEEGAIGICEVVRILGQALHRLLARRED